MPHATNKIIRILLVGGGTGGHFYPLIALAEKLRAHPLQPELYYAGPNPYDQEALTKNGITFTSINAGKRRRYASVLNFLDIFKVFFGTISAIIKLFVLYPDIVVSKGGYTSVPVILAAAFLRIPIVIHESDSVMGKANKFALRFARYIIMNYDSVLVPKHTATVLTLGIPTRESLLGESSTQAVYSLGITHAERPIILVLGGSQGAERINELILDTLDELLVTYTVIHQTGVANVELCKLSAETLIPDAEMRKNYYPVAFLNAETLNEALHVSSIVISRAGSTSIYEIALHHKPSILIPIPERISHDQRTNAYTYARTGAGTVMEETNLTDNLLHAEIERIMQNTDVYNAMVTATHTFGKRDTAEKMSSLIMDIAQEH